MLSAFNPYFLLNKYFDVDLKYFFLHRLYGVVRILLVCIIPNGAKSAASQLPPSTHTHAHRYVHILSIPRNTIDIVNVAPTKSSELLDFIDFSTIYIDRRIFLLAVNAIWFDVFVSVYILCVF